MRTLAIDLGIRRVGLALSDAGGTLATPLEVVHVTSPHQAADRVMDVIQREGVERLVVGLPLNMDDTIGPAAKSTLQWGRELADRSKLPVIFVDERLSSFEAEQTLASRKRAGEKLTHQRKKQQLDAIAAAAVLQAFLDGKLPAIEP
jgi:putative Holliday junction resolvase